jgi:hypothetical protein
MESTKKIKIGQVDVSTLATKATTTRTSPSCKNLGAVISGGGTSTWVSLYKKLIPAGTITDLDEIAVEGKIEALSNVATKTIGFLINYVDDISTATEIGSAGTWASGASRLIMRREYTQRATNWRGISTAFSSSTDENVSILQSSQNTDVDYPFNPAIDNWIYLAVKANVSDTFQKTLFEMKITPNLS